MPRVSAEQRAERREQILAAAIRCVAREGFHKTTMAHVIAESGASAGAVYGHFANKAELIRTIAHTAVSGFAAQLDELIAGPGPLDPADILTMLIHHAERLATTYDVDITRIAVQAWAEACRDEEVRGLVEEQLRGVRDRWTIALRRCQDDGTLGADADPQAVAKVMLGLMPGFVIQRLMLGDVTAESYVEGFRALRGQPAPRR